MTISQEITTLPPAPQRADAPADFIVKADAHVASLPVLVSEVNAWGAQVNTTQGEINDSQAAVAASQAAAAASNTEAASARDTARSLANFKGLWSAQTGSAVIPTSVDHLGQTWRLVTAAADITAITPGTASNWVPVDVTWRGITSSGTLSVSYNDFVLATSAAVDRALPAGAAANQQFVIRNSVDSTQTVRVTNASYTIKGRFDTLNSGDNLIVEPGDTVIIVARTTSILEAI